MFISCWPPAEDWGRFESSTRKRGANFPHLPSSVTPREEVETFSERIRDVWKAARVASPSGRRSANGRASEELLALARREDAQHFPVLGHGAASDLDAVALG